MALGLGSQPSKSTLFPLTFLFIFIVLNTTCAFGLGQPHTHNRHHHHERSHLTTVNKAISSQKLQSRGTACTGRIRSETWWNNLRGDNPCVVLDQLLRKCDSRRSQIPQPYGLLRRVDFGVRCEGSVRECCCSDVAYSLYQACASCQADSKGPSRGLLGTGLFGEPQRKNRGDFLKSCPGPAHDPPVKYGEGMEFPTFTKQGFGQNNVWDYDAAKQFAANIPGNNPNPAPAPAPAPPPPPKSSTRRPQPPGQTETPRPTPKSPLPNPGPSKPAPENPDPSPVPDDPSQPPTDPGEPHPPGEPGGTTTSDPTGTRSEDLNATPTKPEEVNLPEESESGNGNGGGGKDGNSPGGNLPGKGNNNNGNGNGSDNDNDGGGNDGDGDGGSNNGGGGSDPDPPSGDPNVSTRRSSGNIPAIVGGVIGGLILAGIIGTLCFCVIRNRRRARPHTMLYDYSIEYDATRPEKGIVGGNAGAVWGLGDRRRSGVASAETGGDGQTLRTSGYDYNGTVWTQGATMTMLPPMPAMSTNEKVYGDDASESASMRSWTGRAN